jgi:hypothetical protein
MMRRKKQLQASRKTEVPLNNTLIKQKFQASGMFREAWNSN